MKRNHLAQRMKLCLSVNITNPLYNSKQLEERLMDGWITFDILNRGRKLSPYLTTFSMELEKWKIIYFNQLGKYVLCTVFALQNVFEKSLYFIYLWHKKHLVIFWATLKLCSAALLRPLTTCVVLFLTSSFYKSLSRNFQANPRWLVLVCCWLSWSTNILWSCWLSVGYTTYFSVRPL